MHISACRLLASNRVQQNIYKLMDFLKLYLSHTILYSFLKSKAIDASGKRSMSVRMTDR